MHIRYRQGAIAAAREEAVKYAELFAPSLRHVPLTDFFDACLRQAQVDDEEPELSRWLWPRLNLPVSSKTDWLVRLRWGLRINYLLRDWLLANRERLDELDEVVEPPDWSLLANAKEQGKPIVVAGAHLGPASVAIRYLDRLDHSLVMAIGNPLYSLAMGSKPFVSAAEMHNIVQLRDILTGLGTVYLAGDGRRGRSRFPANLFGATVFLREGAAALARLSQAQAFWYAARWVGNRIKLDLIPGPAAMENESREAWNARWFSFYMAQFESYLLAGPENVRSKTLWFVDRR
ncbi:MAG: hypothetical protein ACREC3_03305 [Methyloceanibacter sp.]